MRFRRASSDSTTSNFSVLDSIRQFLEMVPDPRRIQFADLATYPLFYILFIFSSYSDLFPHRRHPFGIQSVMSDGLAISRVHLHFHYKKLGVHHLFPASVRAEVGEGSSRHTS